MGPVFEHIGFLHEPTPARAQRAIGPQYTTELPAFRQVTPGAWKSRSGRHWRAGPLRPSTDRCTKVMESAAASPTHRSDLLVPKFLAPRRRFALGANDCMVRTK